MTKTINTPITAEEMFAILTDISANPADATDANLECIAGQYINPADAPLLGIFQAVRDLDLAERNTKPADLAKIRFSYREYERSTGRKPHRQTIGGWWFRFPDGREADAHGTMESAAREAARKLGLTEITGSVVVLP